MKSNQCYSATEYAAKPRMPMPISAGIAIKKGQDALRYGAVRHNIKVQSQVWLYANESVTRLPCISCTETDSSALLGKIALPIGSSLMQVSSRCHLRIRTVVMYCRRSLLLVYRPKVAEIASARIFQHDVVGYYHSGCAGSK